MNFILKLEENIKGRDFIVGDIHGCFTILSQKLEELNFDQSIDRVLAVGDLVDRGLESEKCLEWISKDWFYTVLGNHEDMAIDYYRSGFKNGYRMNYERNGGKWFIDLSENEQKEFVNVFDTMPLAIEFPKNGKKYGIIHAACPTRDWNDLTDESLRDYGLSKTCIWDRDLIFQKHSIKNIDMIYHGHTPLLNDMIVGNRHYIDTGIVFGGKLTIIQL